MLFSVGVESPKTENGVFSLCVPALFTNQLSCVSFADSPDEIEPMVIEAIDLILAIMIEEGKDISKLKDLGFEHYKQQKDFSHCDDWLSVEVELAAYLGEKQSVKSNESTTSISTPRTQTVATPSTSPANVNSNVGNAVVTTIVLVKKGNHFEGIVPASEISSRTIVIPSFSFKAESTETSKVAIYIDEIKIAESSISGIHQQIVASGTTSRTPVSGSVSGAVSGSVSGYVSGYMSGLVGGYVNGYNASGYVDGKVSGKVSDRVSGSVSGNVRGEASGVIPATTISSSFWLDIPTFGSISGYKQITGKSVLIKVAANNETALREHHSLVAFVA